MQDNVCECERAPGCKRAWICAHVYWVWVCKGGVAVHKEVGVRMRGCTSVQEHTDP